MAAGQASSPHMRTRTASAAQFHAAAIRLGLPGHFAVATPMNAVDRLRRLTTLTTVRRPVALGRLGLRLATDAVGAVIHVALLIELDVAHLLFPFPPSPALDRRSRSCSPCDSTRWFGAPEHVGYARLAGRSKAISVPRTCCATMIRVTCYSDYASRRQAYRGAISRISPDW